MNQNKSQDLEVVLEAVRSVNNKDTFEDDLSLLQVHFDYCDS